VSRILLGLLPSLLSAQVVTQHDVHRTSSGYVFYAPTAQERSYLLSNEGRVVHSWPGSGQAGLAVKLLPDGSILRTGIAFTTIFFAGSGVGGQVEKRSFNGALLWTYRLPSERVIQHHDFEALPNGNVLMVAWELKTPEEARAAGRDPSRTPANGVWSEAIFEVKPVGATGGEIVWEWHAWDHLVQDFDRTRANFGNVKGNVRRLDANYRTSATDPDWLHMNAVAYNEKLDQIVMSVRGWSELWIVDHSTTKAQTASSFGGKRGRGGDLLYRWGNAGAYGLGAQALFEIHDAHWIADDLPGAGRLLIFNNGVGRGYSSADEIDTPIDAAGNYVLNDDGTFGPREVAWTFGETAGPNFFTRTAGAAHRLPNGNTMLCISNASRVVEVTPEKEIVWSLNLGAGEAGGYTFRATRFSLDSPQLAKTPFASLGLHVWHAATNRRELGPGALAVTSTPGTVSITDATGFTREAVAANNVTFQTPRDVASGPARVTLRGSDGLVRSRDVRIEALSPGLFAATSVVFDGSVYLSIYATGVIAGRTPPVVTSGDLTLPLLDSEPQPQFIGVDQINVGPLPAELLGKRDLRLLVTVDGIRSNALLIAMPSQ